MAQKSLTLDEIKEMQKEFEEDFWVAPEDEEGKTRHIHLHLSKLMGKLAKVTEPREHGHEVSLTQLKQEVIPDLFIYALSLADVHDVDLQQAYLDRLEQNKKKVSGWKE